jgi:hypothetical protein
MHTKEYENVIKQIKEIKKECKKGENASKTQIKQITNIIFAELKKLYYYDEIYVYAHSVFNNIRRSGIIKQIGGGLSLEEFKKKIREKIKMIMDQ